MNNNCRHCKWFVVAVLVDENVPFNETQEPPEDPQRIRAAGGSCHRNAPLPLAGGSGQGWSDWEWPAVSPMDGCGEWDDTQ